MRSHGQEEAAIVERSAEALESVRGGHQVVPAATVPLVDAQAEHTGSCQSAHARRGREHRHLASELTHALVELDLCRTERKVHRVSLERQTV
jgi:hypothetical protein